MSVRKGPAEMSSHKQSGEVTGGSNRQTPGSCGQNEELIEHIACASSAALSTRLSECSRAGQNILCGSPRRLPASPAAQINYFLTLDGAQSIIEHSVPDQVISVECGISIKSLQNLLSANKQWFPLCLANENISLMEYINQGSSGPLEHGYGEARDLVLGLRAGLASGEIIKCGGKVVKNVSGYDLCKLFTGSQATLSIPFSADLRLYALPEKASSLLFAFEKIESAFDIALKLCRSGLPISCLELSSGDLLRGMPGDLRPEELGKEILQANAILCIQLHGMSSVVDELEIQLLDLSCTAARSSLSPESAEKFWKFIAGPHLHSVRQRIEIAGQSRMIEKILNEGSKRFDFSWTARPGRNKGLLLLPETENSGDLQDSCDKSEEIIEWISSKCRESSTNMTIASSDRRYLRRVRNLPSEDIILKELKHRIKREFDPQGILNPLTIL